MSQRLRLLCAVLFCAVLPRQACPSLLRTTRTSSCSGSCWMKRHAPAAGAYVVARA